MRGASDSVLDAVVSCAMTRMLIADSFTVPRVGIAVTGRPELTDIREGDRLWLNQGAMRHKLTVRGVGTSVRGSSTRGLQW